MALPLLPIAVIGGAKLISDIWQSDKMTKEALSVNYEAYTTVESASRKLQAQNEKLDGTLKKLANRKKGIMNTSLPKFVEIHQKVVQINFEKFHNVDIEQSLTFPAESLNNINKMISVSGVSMSDKEILGTFLFSFEYGGIGGAIKKDARINLDVAYTRSDEAEVIAYNIDNTRIALEGINAKAESFLKLLAQLNALFLKSMNYTTEIIERNGYNVENYNDEEIDAIMNCINFAKALSDILKAPLFDSNGKLSNQINETLKTGNEYIKKFQTVK